MPGDAENKKLVCWGRGKGMDSKITCESRWVKPKSTPILPSINTRRRKEGDRKQGKRGDKDKDALELNHSF